MNGLIKTVFRHETQQGGTWYSCAFAGKNAQGETEYDYWTIDFPKDTDIKDRSRVEFKDFFETYYTRKDGTKQFKYVVKEWQPASGEGFGQRQHGGWKQQPRRQQGTFEELEADCPF